MGKWKSLLKANPTDWLLEPDNPSVRYWTLVDILNRPAEAQEVRAAIAQHPLVQELLAKQHPSGDWGDDETKPMTAAGTLGVLGLLYMHGVEPDGRTAVGCDSFLRFCQNECGGFSMVKTRRSGIFPCTTGVHLPMLLYFGLGDDPRVRQAFEFVIKDMARGDALDCGCYQHRDCLWGAIAALDGLAVLPVDMRSSESRAVVRRLADALLDAEYDFEGEHKRWLTFGVPRVWDLLSALRVLAAHGYGQDPRFGPLLDLVLARQDEQGRWLCGSVSRTWPLEKRNRPSKWVTLGALRLLRRMSTGGRGK
ncbi:MAG: hypothetical protein AB8I69_17710 [Anaerolineae bacterium]|jgi:hypothetical protein